MSGRAGVGIFGDHEGMSCALAAGLAERGHGVAVVCPSPTRDAVARALAALGAGSVDVFGYVDQASDVARALGAAGAALGTLVGVVDATAPGTSARPAKLADLVDEEWAERTETPLRQALHRLQGAHELLRTRGGHVVVILPSLALSGAPGLVPWVSVAEGRRALAKAAARAWGEQNITVNCVVVPSSMLTVPVEGSPGASLDRPGLPPPSLPEPPGARIELAGVVSQLVSADLSVLTGQTLAVDGGIWMSP